MKVALVTDTFFPRINGVSTSVDTLAQELLGLGHTVHVFAPAFPGYEDEVDYVHRFPSWTAWVAREDRVARPWYRREVKRFRDYQFDIVHTHTPFTLGTASLRWARRLGAPVVHTYHTLFRDYAKHYIRLFPRRISEALVIELSRMYCEACDVIVAPSASIRDELLTYRISRQVVVIPTGVQVARFSRADPVAFRARYRLGLDERLLLFAGRLAEEKNVAFLLDVLALVRDRHPDARLVLAGSGPAERQLKAQAQQMGLSESVCFLGYLTGSALADCYASADLFVFPSVTETQGLVILEALAAGTPVVAVSAMGVRDAMASGQGGILTGLDVQEFAQAVLRLLDDASLYERVKSECHIAAEQSASSRMARRMVDLYESLLSGAGTS